MAEVHSTYRLQLRPDFGYGSAAALADYLAALGVSHAFISPGLEAAPGSQHGYDVAAHDRLSPELGGEAAFARWNAALRRAGLGQVLDIVPNHMSIVTARNRWWWDVLRHGEASRYAGYFDIQWRSPGTAGAPEKVVLPWLKHSYPATLAAGELQLARCGDAVPSELGLRYGEMTLPLALGSVPAEISEPELAALNADTARLADILNRQHYRLAHWRAADVELGYRRFFDVSSLVGLRMERPEVFAATHALVLGWLRDGTLDGVRIDHLDGLREPQRYLEALHASAPGAWIVAEKILARGEALPAAWPLAGTTGYDFLNLAMGLFVAPAGEAALNACYRAVAGETPEFAGLAVAGRRRVLQDLLHSELRRLSGIAWALRRRHPELGAGNRAALDLAIGNFASRFAVYRTYVAPEGEATAPDAAAITGAHAVARAADPAHAGLYDALREILLGQRPGTAERDFLLRFQQLTPAVYAKGVEDTAFYQYQRLVALNEVGGHPDHFGITLAEFHAASAAAQQRWPATMLTTATHDTKRGEDVRARLCLLSEVPEAWQQAVLAWQRHNQRHHGPAGPDANIEYLFYQTLVGAWPIGEERLQAYLLKAAREAKRHTSWRRPQAAYEKALRGFVSAALRDAAWMEAVAAFTATLVTPGWVNALAQTLLKMTAPGVPDIYNGAELWDLSLVDPDNRRPVDFELRRRLLAELEEAPPPEAIWARRAEGLPKLWLIRQCLRLRRERPQWWGASGTYTPLWASGNGAERVVAYLRGGGAAAVAPRWGLSPGGWGDTTLTLPPGVWRNQLTGERLDGGRHGLGEWLARFPVALWAREEEA